MNDKEKQICKHFDEKVCSRLNCKKDCKYYGKANCKTCIHEDICQLRTFSYCEEEVKEKGCEHYQPKLTEDSVVLTKEEADRFRGQTLNFKKVKAQARKEAIKELLTAQLKECIEAEKMVLKIRKNKDDLYYNGFSLAITNLKMYIKELTRQYEVEITND